MTTPLNLQRSQSPARPPLLDGQFYRYWKIQMSDYLMAEDIVAPYFELSRNSSQHNTAAALIFGKN